MDASQLRNVLEMMGQKATEEEVYRMISSVDDKNIGKITLD